MAMLQLGSSGPDVIDLQDKLRAHGFDPGPSDGSALEAFQRGTGLTADGVAGPQTVAALGLAVPAAVVSLIPSVTVPTESSGRSSGGGGGGGWFSDLDLGGGDNNGWLVVLLLIALVAATVVGSPL